jgi:hypothetical protein
MVRMARINLSATDSGIGKSAEALVDVACNNEGTVGPRIVSWERPLLSRATGSLRFPVPVRNYKRPWG